jgi:similar to stage IV sporulation protein
VSIPKIRYAVTGYLELSVEGRATEKFINLAMHEGIPLWNIRHGPEYAVLNADVDSFFDLRHLAKRSGCRLRIKRKAGLAFIISRLFRRRGLAAGLIIFVATLYTLSSFVLFVSVEGNERLESEHIRRLAAEAGARPGLPKWRLNKDELAHQLIIAEPELAWVGVQIRGTRMVIEVKEKIKSPVAFERPGHLVAAKDGLVYDVLVISGVARVAPGDTVSKGQVLIEGALRPQAQQGDTTIPPVVAVRARGEVWARVWYEGYGEAALVETERVPTGRYVTVWTLLIDGQPVLRVGRQQTPYIDYEQSAVRSAIFRGILPFPVELLTESSYEIERRKQSLTLKQAHELAAERARFLAESQLPAGVAVESVAVTNLDPGRAGYVGVRHVLETRENIAEDEDPGGD